MPAIIANTRSRKYAYGRGLRKIIQIETTEKYFKVICSRNLYDDRKSSQITLAFFSLQNERKSEQAHIPHAPTLLENAVYNEWQFQALVTGNPTENQFHPSCTK